METIRGNMVEDERARADCDALAGFHDEVRTLIQDRCPRCLAERGPCLAATMIALDTASDAT